MHFLLHLVIFIGLYHPVPKKVQAVKPPDPPKIEIFIPAPKGACIYRNVMDVVCSSNWEVI